jgi:hypothetical protein
MHRCDYCGKENDDASVYCAGCGGSLVKPDDKDDQSFRGVFRVFTAILGFGLLFLFFHDGIWRDSFRAWMTFGALTGLFIGYGIGGDLWGARLFDLFTGQNSRRGFEKKTKSHKKKR